MTDQATTKPFVSQAQAGWAFATGQPFAKRWARQTGPYKRLPYKVRQKALEALTEAALKNHDPDRAAAIAAIIPRLKGTPLAPGVTRLHGDLCNVHGRYGSCRAAGFGGAGSKRVAPKTLPKAPKPKAGGGKKAGGKKSGGKKAAAKRKPIKTDEQKRAEQAKKRTERQQAKQTEHEQNRKKVLEGLGIDASGQAALSALREGQQPDADAVKRAGLVEAGLAEQAADGSYRLTASGRATLGAADQGDAGRAGDTISGARDRLGARQTRQAAAAERKRQADAKRAAAQAKRGTAAHTAGPKKTPTPKPAAGRIPSGSSGRSASAGAAGGGGGKGAPSSPPKAQLDPALRDAANQLSTDGTVDSTTEALLIRNGLARRNKDGVLVLTGAGLAATKKSFTVFKDSSGADRWIARTTTAFEDRDGEVISTKALEVSAASDAARGPLRWWHSGRPDPLNAGAPWGVGIDLGWCDFAATHGRTLIESGTFKSAAIARAVAEHADKLELSPGFFHAAAEPDAAGVFHHIRIFERSLVPTWAGRASNYYTGLKVQGGTMDQKKIEALQTLGLPEATIKELLGEAQQAEKSADADNVRYKESRPVVDFFRQFFAGEQATTKDAPTTTITTTNAVADEPPDPLIALKAQLDVVVAELAALKAAPPIGADAEDAAEAPETPGETPDAEDLAEAPEEDAGGLTLSPEDLAAIGQAVGAALEPLIGAMGITQKLDGHMGELKSMLGGFAKQKDDGEAEKATHITALKAAIDQQQAALAELLGDTPRGGGYRPTAASDNTLNQLHAATKDTSPDSNDWSDMAAKFFPGMLPG